MMSNCDNCIFRGQWCEKENKCPLFKEYPESEEDPEEERIANMIDREKVIKGLNNIGREIVNTIGHGEAVPYLRTIDDAIDLLKEQEEHKTGKWEVKPSNKEQGERDFIWWKCSECGQVIYSESEHDREEFHKYCGRCGAKMT